jgi:hypothetical protein
MFCVPCVVKLFTVVIKVSKARVSVTFNLVSSKTYQVEAPKGTPL